MKRGRENEQGNRGKEHQESRLPGCEIAQVRSQPALESGRGLPHSKTWRRNRTAQSGFTMVEIAIAIAVIAFALVAIVSILPTGLQVQRDNREETIINHDGMYWLEAIRSGNAGSYELGNYVEWLRDNTTPTPLQNLGTTEILGRLSVNQKPEPQIKVRAISGVATERDHASIGFEYLLTSRLRQSQRNTNMFELRLVLGWPVPTVEDITNCLNRRVFKTIVSGRLAPTNGFAIPLSIMEPNAYGPPL